MKINRTKNATRNMFFGTLLKLYQVLLPFAMRSAMVYTLGVEYLGLNSLFTSVLQVLNLAELGVGSAMVFSMYKPIVDDDGEKICALMNLYKWYYRIIGAVVLVGGIVISPIIPKLISGSVPNDINIYVLYLLNLSATVLTYWLFAYKNSILQAHQRTDIASRVTIITDTIKYLLQLAALFILHDYYLYVLAILFTQVITNIVTAIQSNRLYPQYQAKGRLERTEVRTINKRIADLFTAKLGATIVGSADTIVISAFLGLATLAIYQNYYYVMTSVTGFIMVLLNSCTAGIGNSILSDNPDKVYGDFKKFAFMAMWLVGICVCCFLNLYQPFITLWMGEDYLLDMGCVVLMCLYFYLYITNHFMCTYKDAAGIWHEDRFRPLISALVNLALNIILVRYIGIFAIILSTVLSYILVCMPWLMYNIFRILFKRPLWDFLKLVFCFTIVIFLAAALSYFVCVPFSSVNILNLCIKLIISISIPNILFMLLMSRAKEYSGAIDMVDRITKNRFHNIFIKLRRTN